MAVLSAGNAVAYYLLPNALKRETTHEKALSIYYTKFFDQFGDLANSASSFPNHGHNLPPTKSRRKTCSSILIPCLPNNVSRTIDHVKKGKFQPVSNLSSQKASKGGAREKRGKNEGY
jgi:hypothetical protein